MTKKLLLTALAALFLAFGAFADEVKEEIITLNGTVKTSYRRHAELTSGGQSYELMMPRYITDDLADGVSVVVEGYILTEDDDCPQQVANPNSKFFVVTKITIGNEVINLENFKRGHRRGGDDDEKRGRGDKRGGGRHHGRGRG